MVRNRHGQLKVTENGCAKATSAFEKKVTTTPAKIKNRTVSTDEAIAEACRILKNSHTPLLAGLGADAAGMRQIMRLADITGAVLDHLHGDALIRNTLVLQDLGWIMTTMAEIKNRADLIIFAGTDAADYPRFFERVVWHKHALFNKKNKRRIVYIGDKLNTTPGISPAGDRPVVLNCKTNQIGEVISSLHTLLTGIKLDVTEVVGIKVKVLEQLVEQMQGAQYGVVVWSPGELDFPHSELTIQNFCEIVKYLTRFTRFAGFSLGGNDGATTANNLCAWQSGYPLRVNFNKGYPDYNAHYYSTRNLLKHKEVDALLWISSFSSAINPPRASIPTIILAPPDLTLNFRPEVYLPVSTPGLDHAGQLFRTDGVVALPLKQLRDASCHSVDTILKNIIRGMR